MHFVLGAGVQTDLAALDWAALGAAFKLNKIVFLCAYLCVGVGSEFLKE